MSTPNIKKPGNVNTTISVDTKSVEKRVSPAIENKLNKQIEIEFGASQLYRAAAVWCDYNGLFNLSKFLDKHAGEEMGHMDKVKEYLLDRNCLPVIPAVPQPITQFTDILDVIRKAYEHEKFVTSTYVSLADDTISSKDFVTFTFIQWYLKEQIEEEVIFANLIDRIEYMTKHGLGQIEIDSDLDEVIG
jgi:ferritin